LLLAVEAAVGLVAHTLRLVAVLVVVAVAVADGFGEPLLRPT
jgi:hypothetical protein